MEHQWVPNLREGAKPLHPNPYRSREKDKHSVPISQGYAPSQGYPPSQGNLEPSLEQSGSTVSLEAPLRLLEIRSVDFRPWKVRPGHVEDACGVSLLHGLLNLERARSI